MAAFVLIPGAGGSAWYWSRLVPELQARGHTAVAVDLPAADEDAGLQAYADTVVAAASALGEVVLVAQSMGGLTAPLACDRLPVRLLVLLNAMVPQPGETGGAWWTVTGQDRLPAAEDPFLHDLPADVLAEALALGEPAQSVRPFEDPWPLAGWPDVPTRFLQGRDDRLFPLAFQQRVVRDRLGLPVDELPGGHLVALSQPVELADRLVGYLEEPVVTGR